MECTPEVPRVHEVGEEEVRSLYGVLCGVPDYGRKRGRRYAAAQVLVILMLAKLAGEQTISGAAHWARLRSEWLTIRQLRTCGLTSLPAQQASPATLLALVQAHWQIENRNHWRRDATLREDACIVRHTLVAVILALLNATILAIFDIRQVKNARAMLRTFDAFPDQALDLLIKPL